MEGTAKSALRGEQMLGSSMTILSRATNSMFPRGCALSRSRSISLGPRQIVFLVGLSIAQHHEQLAERTVEIGMPGIGHVAEATRQARGIGKNAITETTTVRSQIESQMVALAENLR